MSSLPPTSLTSYPLSTRALHPAGRLRRGTGMKRADMVSVTERQGQCNPLRVALSARFSLSTSSPPIA